MKTKVSLSAQVESFVKARAPEPRKRLMRAIKGLRSSTFDTKSLEGRLAGYSRLRVGGYRVIFAERTRGGTRTIECIYAEARGIVYELFENLVVQELQEK